MSTIIGKGRSPAIFRGHLTLMEHMYFASREYGTLYETEPVIGNYALTYALGLCHSPYDWAGPPRYAQDLLPLNQQGIYVTPGTFDPETLHFTFGQFNAQSDSYYFRFGQNAIVIDRDVAKGKTANFPQSGRLRMVSIDSTATFFVIANDEMPSNQLPQYIRLGKFNSKAKIEWERLTLTQSEPAEREQQLDFLLNAADLSPSARKGLRTFSLINIYPAPLISHCRMQGPFWRCRDSQGEECMLPADLRYGVETLVTQKGRI